MEMHKSIFAAVAAICATAAFADLPSGYRQLDYVDTDGSTWVNTLYRPTCTNAVEIKAAIKDVSTWQCLYCTRRLGNNRTYTLLVNGATMKTRFDYKTKQVTGDLALTSGTPYVFAANPSEDDGQEEVAELDKAWTLTCTQDGELTATVNDHYFTVDGAAYFCLFGSYLSPGGDAYASAVLNDDTTVGNLASCRFYYFKVWDTKDRDNLRCHIVPVYGEAEHAVGLYDLVAGRFLPAHGEPFVEPISSSRELSANEDWSSAPVMIADGVTVDLNGHDLTVASVGTNAVSALNPCYEDIAYVTGTGNQTIPITGFRLPSTAKVEMKVNFSNLAGTQFLFASRGGQKVTTYTAMAIGTYFRFDLDNNKSDGTTGEIRSTTVPEVNLDYDFVFDGSARSWTINGVAQPGLPETSDFIGGNDLTVLGGNGANYASCRLYYFTVTTNDVTILDLRPVRRISDGAVGLYDSVGNSFYVSSTATALLAPVDVPKFTNSCETVSELCVGREWVPGYTVVDRITSTTKGARINTDYVPVATDRIEMRTCYSEDPATIFFFCSRTGTRTTDQISVLLTATGLRFDFRGTQHSTTEVPDRDTPFTIAIDGNAKSCYLDGEFIHEYSQNDFTPSANLYLFAAHANGTSFGYHPLGSIYWFKVTGADGTLKLDMVPAVRNQDNVAGLYDRVRRKFYPSSTTTAFTAGTQVGDGKLYIDVDSAFAGSEIKGNITLVKKGESAFDGGGMSLATTLRPEAGTVGGVTLTDGATLDLSAFSETFSLDENAISFANGASITIALGSRNVSSKTPLVSWTTAPSDVGTLTFLGEDGRRLTVKDDGVYLPRKGLMMIVR